MSIVPSPPQMGETDKWACAVCGHDEKLHAWDIVKSGIEFSGCQALVDGGNCTCNGFEDKE